MLTLNILIKSSINLCKRNNPYFLFIKFRIITKSIINNNKINN